MKNFISMQFFLHRSDQNHLDPALPLEKRILWYCPGFIEIRQFRNRKGIAYDLHQHTQLFPQGLNRKVNSKFPIFKHYPHRSPQQVLKKIEQTHKTQFGGAYSKPEIKDIYLECLPRYKQARRFDGNFHEFELSQQKPLWWRMLMQWKYR